MRYDNESDYPYDYDSIVENADFDDLVDEVEDEEGMYEVDDDEDVQEWANYYHNIADEIIDE
jgi:hypothetical protein